MAREITLSNGMLAIVDDHNYEWLMQWKWTASPSNQYKGWRHNPKWYACRWQRIDGKAVKKYMHREIMKTRRGHVTDHLDGNGLNNLEENLRNCTQKTNCQNRQTTPEVDLSDVWS